MKTSGLFSKILIALVFSGCVHTLNAQPYEYPFQNPKLSDEERIDNIVSLMTLDEKIRSLSGQGVTRLGVTTPGTTEAIHGIVRGGSSNINQARNNQAAFQTQAAGAAPQGVQQPAAQAVPGGQPAMQGAPGVAQPALQTGLAQGAQPAPGAQASPQAAPQGAPQGMSAGMPGGMPGGRNMVRMVNSTTFPQGYGLGETWDKDILKTVGEVMSYEARYYSQNAKNGGRYCLALWAPNADLARDPRWGRTEESFGEDPFLVGELVVAETKGIQGNDPKYWRAAAVYKHFLANSHEDGRCYTSSDFDESLFRDYYSYGFWRGVKKGGGESLMLSYNAYQGVPSSVNPYIQNILINEWGMQGMILNDGGAMGQLVTHHKYAKDKTEALAMSIKAGISRFLESCTVETKDALEKGMITEDLLNRNVKFNLYSMLRLGLMDKSDANPYKDLAVNDDIEPWKTQKFKDIARLATQKSVVLLKNEGNLLPLDKNKVKKIAVVGNRAEEVLKDWYGALPAYAVSPLQGIKNAVDTTKTEVRFLRWDSDGGAQKLAQWADVVIVCVGNHPLTSPDWDSNNVQAPWGYSTSPSDGREAVDRRSLQLDTEDLIKVVWQANHNTVVALISSFPYTINWTQEHVPAIVHMTQCSQELGNALADVLFGKYNPAGRLNQTWVKDILDLPNMLDYNIRNGRTYMYAKEKPLYPFGFGLSYTTFNYSNLNVNYGKENLTVKVDIQNTGSKDGEEVVQIYLKLPNDDAAQRLRGFDRVAIAKGEKKTVTIEIPQEDLMLWNPNQDKFALPKGDMEVRVGASSADIKLSKTVKL